jgi:peroxiredoxin Q/BCP
MLAVGDVAPDFRVDAQRTLHDVLKTHVVVLFFFPRAFTPGCTRESKGFCQLNDRLHDGGVQVIGMSADNAQRGERFVQDLGLPYPLVTDPKGDVLRAYGVRWPIIGLARRATFVIGRDRTIHHVFHSERDVEGHLTQATAEALRLASA